MDLQDKEHEKAEENKRFPATFEAPPVEATRNPQPITGQGGFSQDPTMMSHVFGHFVNDDGAKYPTVKREGDASMSSSDKVMEAGKTVEDQHMARGELMGQFDVVPDGYQGPKKGNTVTYAQFANLARIYSDIRRGRSDLQLDTSECADPDKYKQAALGDLVSIMQTPSGRELVASLDYNEIKGPDGKPVHHKTTIGPHLDVNGRETILDDNGEAEATNKPASRLDQRTAAAGGGSDSRVSFSAGDFKSIGGGAIKRSDIGLYHELTHSFYQTRGLEDKNAITAQDGKAGDPRRGTSDAGKEYRREHQATGLGAYSGRFISEDHYRAERNELKQDGATELLPGDGSIIDRRRYQDFKKNASTTDPLATWP